MASPLISRLRYQRVLLGARRGVSQALKDMQPTDSVEKVEYSDCLNSGTTTTEEPIHHIKWFSALR